ncbi:MAG: replication protein, partial [Pseudomonadota bacterium]
GKTKRAAATKTTFHIKSAAGQVKCTAAQGRLEIRVDRDFSSIDRQRLEAAIAELVEGLG